MFSRLRAYLGTLLMALLKSAGLLTTAEARSVPVYFAREGLQTTAQRDVPPLIPIFPTAFVVTANNKGSNSYRFTLPAYDPKASAVPTELYVAHFRPDVPMPVEGADIVAQSVAVGKVSVTPYEGELTPEGLVPERTFDLAVDITGLFRDRERTLDPITAQSVVYIPDEVLAG